ncbi:MAG: hypothetical protein ISS95_01200 [Candidatus Aenigmarchaeota archaeon]|nr:hypothetical protein [Candidatus Aenigmarchaeota archaeon]
MRGIFIVLYGLDHVQKSTLAKSLVNYLKNIGKGAEYVKYPVYTIAPSGFYIDKVLRAQMKMSEDEFQVWFTINRYQYQPLLKKMLDEGKIVIAEDYIGTGMAWGGCKGTESEWVNSLNSYLIQADLNILLDTDRFRGSELQHVHENQDIVEKVRERFLEIAKEKEWIVIDAKGDTQKLFYNVLSVIKEKVGNSGTQ